MLSYLVIGLILVEVALQVFARSAIRGSMQRYVLLSFRRIASWLVNLAFVGQGLLQAAEGQTLNAAWSLAFGGLCIFVEIRNHRNDDDWFNGRGKKIWGGIKRMLTPPERVSVPAPAFG